MHFTVAFQALPHQAEQHLAAVITEGRSTVGMHVEGVWPDLEVFKRGGGCSQQRAKMSGSIRCVTTDMDRRREISLKVHIA